MNITTSEAEESLNAVETVMKNTRRAISDSGGYIFFIIWGIIWLLGFSGSHFFDGRSSGIGWTILNISGGIASAIAGVRMGKGVRNPQTTTLGKRVAVFWLLLILYAVITIAITWPIDRKQLAMLIVLFVMVGWLALGLLLSFGTFKIALTITALSLLGYFFLPEYFFLLMAFLGGGGMIVFGLFIKAKW